MKFRGYICKCNSWKDCCKGARCQWHQLKLKIDGCLVRLKMRTNLLKFWHARTQIISCILPSTSLIFALSALEYWPNWNFCYYMRTEHIGKVLYVTNYIRSFSKLQTKCSACPPDLAWKIAFPCSSCCFSMLFGDTWTIYSVNFHLFIKLFSHWRWEFGTVNLCLLN